jgi:hypothetical protein
MRQNRQSRNGHVDDEGGRHRPPRPGLANLLGETAPHGTGP